MAVELRKNDLRNIVISSSSPIRTAVPSSDGRFLAVVNTSPDVVTVHNADSSLGWSKVCELRMQVCSLAFRPGLGELALARVDAHAIERRAIWAHMSLPPIRFAYPTCVSYSDDGRYLAAGNREGRVMVWDLEAEPGRRIVLHGKITSGRITSISISQYSVVMLTAGGGCFRIPMPHADAPGGMRVAAARPALVGGDNRPYQWDVYAHAVHPFMPLEAFGGEGGLLVSRHQVMDSVWVRQTRLGRYIHRLKFFPSLRLLLAAGEEGVELWRTESIVLSRKWMVSGDFAKLGRAVATVVEKVESVTAPEPGLKPLAVTDLENCPAIFWANVNC
ncbi:MAG TPA: WD40 repeat domain-containing protein [Candidatus Obscuribacterales bacterium]